MVSQEIEGAEICRIATVELVLLTFDATSSCTTSPVSMTQVGRTKMSALHTRIRSMYISVHRVGQSRLLESHIETMDVVQNKVVFTCEQFPILVRLGTSPIGGRDMCTLYI